MFTTIFMENLMKYKVLSMYNVSIHACIVTRRYDAPRYYTPDQFTTFKLPRCIYVTLIFSNEIFNIKVPFICFISLYRILFSLFQRFTLLQIFLFQLYYQNYTLVKT